MWAIVDFESTGLDVNLDRIIEFAVVKYDPEKKKMLNTNSYLVAAEDTVLSKEIVEITGITHEMLMSWAIKYDRMIAYFETLFPTVTHIVAHNATGFDVPMLKAEYARQSKNSPPMKVIDTYCDIPWGPQIKNHGLSYLCTDHGFLNPWPHRALPDALSLMKLISLYDHKEIELRADSPSIILEAKVSFEEREKAKTAGFRWFPEQKKWKKTVKQLDLDKAKFDFQVQQVMA